MKAERGVEGAGVFSKLNVLLVFADLICLVQRCVSNERRREEGLGRREGAQKTEKLRGRESMRDVLSE